MEIKELIPITAREGYDRWSEVYDVEDNPLMLLEERHFRDLLGDVNSLSVADVGCGTGRHAVALAHAGAKVTALDFSQRMLAKARKKPDAESIEFIQHDLTQPLPLANETFDGATCCLVLEHIANLDRIFAEMHRVCKHGGFLVVSEMHPAMRLKGAQARFIDPDTGSRICPTSYPHRISDFVMAAVGAGWEMDHLSEHSVDEKLAAQSPRGVKYLNWPLLLLMRLRKGQVDFH